MADEPAKIILGETVISAPEQPQRAGRRFVRKRKKEAPRLTHCENCGAQLVGHYCAQCGQAAIDYRRSFWHIITDLLDSFFNWDSKFFATIGLLIIRPWRLTNEFIAGKRARYVRPLGLYLFVGVLFFFVVHYWLKSIPLQPDKMSPKDRAEVAADLKKENLPPETRRKIEEALNLNSPTPAPTAPADQKASPKPDEQNTSDTGDFGPLLQMGPDKPSTPFEKWLESRAKEKIGEHGTNLQLFLATLFNNLPGMMLCCIPLFAFVLKILYIRRHIHYIDHLVYALHIHTFAYIGVILIGLITIGLNRIALGPLGGWIIAILWVAFAVQILLSIRRVYRQGWFFSIFKFFAGGFVYLLVLSVALAATFFVTLVMP